MSVMSPPPHRLSHLYKTQKSNKKLASTKQKSTGKHLVHFFGGVIWSCCPSVDHFVSWRVQSNKNLSPTQLANVHRSSQGMMVYCWHTHLQTPHKWSPFVIKKNWTSIKWFRSTPSKKAGLLFPYAPIPFASGFGVGFGYLNTF